MRSSSIIQAPDAELYCINCVEEVRFGGRQLEVRFEVTCRFLTGGQKLFIGLLDAEVALHAEKGHGFGVTIDTEDGTVEDMVNDLGVIDYVATPLRPEEPVHLAVEMEKQNRVIIPKIIVNGEALLHPALYLEGAGTIGAFVGTTVLWGGSATFDETSMTVRRFNGTALAS
ncbi:hypothetical protein BH23VER1_BH23VER1_07390 [soil metagenome]